MTKLRTWGPFSLTLPPAEQELLSAWLKFAAAQMGNHVPALPGHVRLQLRVGVVDGEEDRTLGEIVCAVMALLAGEKIVEPSMVADVGASWDRAVGPERLTLSISETTAPRLRIDASTRQRVAEAQRRRWATYRAAGEKGVVA